MQHRSQRSRIGFLLVMQTIAVVPAVTSAVPPGSFPPLAEDTPENTRIERIQRLDGLTRVGRESPELLRARGVIMEQVVHEIDELLQRFPESAFNRDATILKLKHLATLARIDPGHLATLLQTTEQIAAGKPGGVLAAENDYYAIQGFILGARNEDMPDSRRQLGAVERYEAFVRDHPTSDHVPVIRASLVRNLIAMGKLDRARAVVGDLKRESPDHAATHRAAGELNRATAVGRPFTFSHATPDGKVLSTAPYRGRVLILHAWSTAYSRSIRELEQLVTLHERFDGKGLAIVGLNVDAEKAAADEAIKAHGVEWPQYFDERGYESDVLIAAGVITFPTYFVVDRNGVLRSIDPGAGLTKLVEQLIAEELESPRGE